MEKRLDTYCGLYCGGCEVFLVNQRGLIEETAKEWEMDPDDLHCNGCKTDITSTFCRNCKIKSCAESKRVEFCYQCNNFPCEIITEFKDDEHPHHSIVLHNLSQIKEKGINNWIKEQETRWSCPECKEKYSWYEDKCSNCGSSIKSCLDDEKELEK